MTTPSTPSKSRPHRHALRGAFLLLLAAFSVYIVRDLALTGPRVRHEAQDALERLFPGLRVEIDAARAERLLSIVVDRLVVFHEDNPQQRIFHARQVRITPRAWPLLRGQWTTGKVVFRRPTFFLQYDGESNVRYIMDVLAEFDERRATLPAAGDIPDVVIESGALSIHGLQRQPYIDIGLRREASLPGLYNIDGRLRNGSDDPSASWTVSGTLDALRQTVSLSLDAGGLALGDPDLRRGAQWLIETLADVSDDPQLLDLLASKPWEGFDVAGGLTARAEAHYSQVLGAPVFEAVLTFDGGASLTWHMLPGAIESVTGKVALSSAGVVFDGLTGTWQGAAISLNGTVGGLDADSGYNLSLGVRGVTMTDESMARFSEGPGRAFFEEFRLYGALDAQAHFAGGPGKEPRHSVIVHGRDLRGYAADFPYTVEVIDGLMRPGGGELTIEHIRLRDPDTGIESVVTGRLYGLPSNRPGLDVTLTSHEPVPLSDAVYEACDADLREVWDSLRPQGAMSYVCRFLREPEVGGMPRLVFDFGLHGLRLQPEAFPMNLREIEGAIRFDRDRITFSGVTGRTEGGGFVEFTGRTDGILDNPVTRLRFRGRDIPVTEPLAVSERENMALHNTVLERIEGFIDVAGDIVHEAGGDRMTVALVAKMRGGQMAIKEFPYPWRDVEGVIELSTATGRPTRMTIESLTGRGPHDLSRLAVTGTVTMEDDASWAELHLRATDIFFDEALHEAAPGLLREALDLVKPRGRFDADMAFAKVLDERYEFSGLIGLKEVAEQTIGTLSSATGAIRIEGAIEDGESAFGGTLDLDRLTVDLKELRRLTGRFEKKDGRLNVYELRGEMYGGLLSGSMQASLAEPRRYSSALKAEGVDMRAFVDDAFPGYDGAPIGGALFGNFRIQGEGMEAGGMVGSGSFQIRGDRVLRYPGALKLLNLLQFSLPVDDDFQEASVDYELVDGAVRLTRIEVACPSLKVAGSGTIGADGALNIRFAPVSTRTGLPLISDLVGLVSNPLMEVSVEGRIDAPVIGIDPMAPIAAPLRMLLGLFAE